MRLRLDIAYDGRDFAGWARQHGLRTVQGELERVLRYLTGETAELTCAGRTDAGVHARGQVAHVDLASAVDLARLNRALPADIRVTALATAPPGFDARFSATWRRYSYRVSDDVTGPTPLSRHVVLSWPRALDITRMNDASAALLGEHDFAAFCKPRDFGTTVRTLHVLSWSRSDDGMAVMDIRADAFCHSMVRALVGVLLPVGDGRRDTSWPADVLGRAVRDPAVTVMPAHPLVLEEVGYPADDELGARQTQTRALRGA